MIYTCLGTLLTLINKHEDCTGKLSVEATSEGKADIWDYYVTDLTADEGLAEIHRVVATLGWKVFPEKGTRAR